MNDSKPCFSEHEITAAAARLYGSTGSARLFPTERDQNARVQLADGRAVVIKISHGDEDAATLAFQQAMLKHVAAADPLLPIPHVVPTAAGADLDRIHGSGERLHFVRALSWLEGEPLAASPRSVPLWQSLGSTLGRLSKALTGFFHPAAVRPDFLWNLDNASEALEWQGMIADLPARAAVARLSAGPFASLADRTARLRQAVLYQDANDHNVLVRGESVTGLIDFGDAVFGRQVNELAVALAYAGMEAEDPLGVFSHVVRHYTAVFPIEPAEAAVLGDLVRLRLAQSICISSRRSGEVDDNPYLAISQAPAQRLLAWFEAHEGNGVDRALCHAAGITLPAAEVKDWIAEPAEWAPERLLARRHERIAPSLSVAYRDPLTIVRGRGAYLYDHRGRPFLDLVNNVAHVGHCHPVVVEAIARQARELNTNARYLHRLLLDYADRIVATMPPSLSVCVFTCSGSEANELAIRMARTATGRKDAVVLDMAYHGHTSALIEISPYKFGRKGGAGRPPFVHVAPMPDPYRGAHRGMTSATGASYAAEVLRTVAEAPPPAFFIAESFLGVGGQIIPPPGFLTGAHAAVRAAGGVCIADEVQVGFGRAGSHMWAFDAQGAIPDIVTLGKPIGAGHPMAAVVTTPEIAREFANGMEYFNTFGGNPVSCAAGMAVLDVIEQEGLMGHAELLGGHVLGRLRELGERYPLIGDVRGQGLFIGAELVRDRETLEPATSEASAIVNRLRHRGILLSTDGPYENVLKVKPPLVLSRSDADFFLDELGDALSDLC